MRKILILIFLMVLVAEVRAQSLDAFKQRLASPVPSQAAFGMSRVTVFEEEDAARAVSDASRISARKFKGYRVCVFFDNGPMARTDAQAAQKLFAENFPGIPVHLFYEKLYFKVTAGNCVTAEEAIILMERVKGTFPKVFIKSEELSVSDLLE